MNTVVFAGVGMPLSVKLVEACLAGLLPGILSRRLRADGKTIGVPYLIACAAATASLHQMVDNDPGLVAAIVGLIVGFVVFSLAPSNKASVFAATCVSVVALAALGLVGFLRMPPADMRHAIAQIRRCGGVVQQSDNPGTTYRDPWWVSFGYGGIDDDRLSGLASDLRKLPQLSLTLSNCSVGDRGLAGLADAENLVWLDLDGTQVTDAGLSHLANLSHLERLDLSRTRISDDGLGNLSGLSSLQTLLLLQTSVTDDGVKRLRKSLRTCHISCKNHR